MDCYGNLSPLTKSGQQLVFNFYSFKENRLPFNVKVKHFSLISPSPLSTSIHSAYCSLSFNLYIYFLINAFFQENNRITLSFTIITKLGKVGNKWRHCYSWIQKGKPPFHLFPLRGVALQILARPSCDAIFWLLSPTDPRYGPGAMWPPLLPERAEEHQGPSTDCHL